MHLETLAEIIGVIGVFVVMIAYLMLQIGRMSPHSAVYSFLNLVGSVFILVSLIYEWNLAAFLMEGSWGIISIFGLLKTSRALGKIRKQQNVRTS